MRVARAFAVATARASTDKGRRGFFGVRFLASAHSVFGVETAETALKTDVTNVTAWAAVNVWPATRKTAFGQYLGMP